LSILFLLYQHFTLLSGLALHRLPASDILLPGFNAKKHPLEELAQSHVIGIYVLWVDPFNVPLNKVDSCVPFLVVWLLAKRSIVDQSVQELIIKVVLCLFPEEFVGILLAYLFSLKVQEVEDRL
jgi:hypothetical protein